MKCFDLPGFASYLALLGAGIAAQEGILLDRAARVIKAEAKRAFGQHRKAVGPGTSPEDDWRDGIAHIVLAPNAHIGSNRPEVEAREVGSLKVMPESFMSGSAFRKAAEVRDLIGDHFLDYLADRRGEQEVDAAP
jgi:hypothetical protein